MPDKDDIAQSATAITNKAIEQLSGEGLDPDAPIRLKQRDLAHIASLATAYTLVGMKEQLEKSQDIIKEYVLNELSSELKDIDKLETKIARLSQRMDLAFKVLDEHYELLNQLMEKKG